jgi:hydroxymethylpyrimidine/phosphomethylpyrimidine kinase
MIPVVLTIGELDPLGAGGIAADLRAFAALRVHGACVPTSVAGPEGEALPPALVERQIRRAFAELDIGAVKTGVAGPAALIEAVAATLADCCAVPVVVDPCLAGRDGPSAAREAADAAEACRARLLPLAAVVTANMAEAALLTGTARAGTLGEMLRQGEALVGLGCAHAVVSGGHGRAESATDILVVRDAAPVEMRAERLDREGLAGLSATFAAAIAANIARGDPAAPAVQYAKLFVTAAIANARGYATGRGPGAPNAFHRMWMAPAPRPEDRPDE